MGKPEGKKPLRRPRSRWEDNIKMFLQEVGWLHGLDCSDSGYWQVAGCCKCIKFDIFFWLSVSSQGLCSM